MYNRGFFNKQYAYEVLSVHLDKEGSYTGIIPFPFTFDTVPYVAVVPKMLSTAKIEVSDVSTTSFKLKITREGMITEKFPLPKTLRFSNHYLTVSINNNVSSVNLAIYSAPELRVLAEVNTFVLNSSFISMTSNFDVGDILTLTFPSSAGVLVDKKIVFSVSTVDNSDATNPGRITSLAVVQSQSDALEVLPFSSFFSTQYLQVSPQSSGTIDTQNGHVQFLQNVTFRARTVQIVSSGSGYKSVPAYSINPSGTGVQISLGIDADGRVSTATLVQSGSFTEMPLIQVVPPPLAWGFATSTTTIQQNGHIDFYLEDGEKEILVGLTNGIYQHETSPVFYAFYINGKDFYVREQTQYYQFLSVDGRLPMRLRIELKDNKVHYFVDEQLLYTSTVVPDKKAYSIFAAFHTTNLTLYNFVHQDLSLSLDRSTLEVVSSVANQTVKYVYFAHEKL